MKACILKNCKTEYYAKGFCKHHYDLNRRNGSPYVMKKEIHGMRNTTEYRSWHHLKERCLNTKNIAYANYGGREITVCDRWINSFTNFYQDMGRKPSSKHSIDRINNDGNYEPKNCRWATSAEQVMNRRMNKKTSSIYPGVRWNKRLNKWQVYFKSRYVGVFINKEEAVRKKKLIEEEYCRTIA